MSSIINHRRTRSLAAVLTCVALLGGVSASAVAQVSVYLPPDEMDVSETSEVVLTPVMEEGSESAPPPSVGEGADSGDALANFERQLASLQARMEQMQVDFAEEKTKNAKKKDKFNLPFNTKVGGQLRLDGVYISQDEDALANFGDVGNSLGVRDLRLTFGGSSYGNLQYAVAFTVNNTITFQDVWLRASDTRYFGDITVGNFYVESGMESVETNWDRVYAMTDEGAAMFRLGRRLGVSSQLFGSDKRSRAFFAIFTASNLATQPHRINNQDNPGVVLNARLTAAPILQEDEDGYTREVFHVGGSYFWLSPAKGANLNLQTTGLGWASSNPRFLSGAIPLNDGAYSVTNIEAAYQHEGFAITGEGYFCSIANFGDSYGTTIATRWLLTRGVTRRYNRQDARFGMVKMPDDMIFLDIKNRMIGGGLGAFEALAKWEWVEANNLKAVSDATYGSVNRVVTGANWFWNEQVYWTFNWEHAFVDAKRNGSDQKGEFDTIIVQGSLKF